MSASDKKKLRKEQAAASITERQKKERNEAKKLKTYTFTFIVLMVLVVAIFLGMTLRTPVTSLVNRNTTAITIDGHKLSTAELNYYYMDYIQNFVNQYSDYGEYAATYLQIYTGLNPNQPLNEQVYDNETGDTWADYFIDTAMTNAQWAYAMYDKAMSEGFTLTDTEVKSLQQQESNIELYASYYGYTSGKAYLRNTYGPGATVKGYMEYTRINTIANNYATQYYEGLEFKDADFREYEKDKFNDFSSYSFSYYYCSVSDYLTHLKLGTTTKGEDGKTSTTYSDEEKETARKAAQDAAKSLAVKENNTLKKLNKAIKALDINKKKDSAAATENKYVVYSSIANEDFQKFVSAEGRKKGDTTVIEIKSGEGDDATVSGYYVVLYQGVDTNKTPLANVQHILVKFSGGTKDKETGVTTYSEAEKKAAKEKAEAILEEFKKGEKQDSEAFGKLAGEKSEDTGSKSNGGLIEDIYRDAGYVESFTNWALKGHKPGDTGIIESEYGYHIMFYKEDGELTYRDFMINAEMCNEAYEEWESGITAKVTVTEKNLKGINQKVFG